MLKLEREKGMQARPTTVEGKIEAIMANDENIPIETDREEETNPVCGGDGVDPTLIRWMLSLSPLRASESFAGYDFFHREAEECHVPKQG